MFTFFETAIKLNLKILCGIVPVDFFKSHLKFFLQSFIMQIKRKPQIIQV